MKKPGFPSLLEMPKDAPKPESALESEIKESTPVTVAILPPSHSSKLLRPNGRSLLQRFSARSSQGSTPSMGRMLLVLFPYGMVFSSYE
jgi:hypothetical protein